MTYTELPAIVDCGGESLVAVTSAPGSASAAVDMRDIGLVVIVGGPQYRAGAHRQFLLLARAAAEHGYAAIRFDRRGTGDATGIDTAFFNTTSDIAAAIGAFRQACPHLKRFVLWGLCDGASAALIYWQRTRDPAIIGLALVNPWVRSEIAHAKARLGFYYLKRIRQREFWKKLISGKVRGLTAARELSDNLAKVTGVTRTAEPASPWLREMEGALQDYTGQILLVLSGDDHTAHQFKEWAQLAAKVSKFGNQGNVAQVDLPDADHTFSQAGWRRQVEQVTIDFLGRLGAVK